MSINPCSPLVLKPSVQNYSWGKVGEQSLVARLIGGFSPTLPYAELWFGAHESAPSLVESAGQSLGLDALIAQHSQALLGVRVVKQFGACLPFLFKVLSVREALSIQAHPDRDLARLLHQNDREHYPDSNHKPEVAIALTKMRLLYGFKRIEQLALIISENKELSALLGPELISETLSYHETAPGLKLSRLYSAIVNAPKETLVQQGELLLNRLQNKAELTPEESLICELAQRFGVADVGIFSSYLMNYEQLEPGEGVYIGPNIPHAYLSGDLIECMANSDNVVRAGLTPKFQDRQTLLSMLDYTCGPIAKLQSIADPGCRGLLRYHTPAAEFSVAEFSGLAPIVIPDTDSPWLVFCLEGSASVCPTRQTSSAGSQQVLQGTAVLIPACAGDMTVQKDERARVFIVMIP